MEDFQYKDYTEDESTLYNDVMNKIMAGLRNGLTFSDACDAAVSEDKELKEFIVDDALKIVIVDLHYVGGLSLEDVASTLKVPFDTVNKAHSEMIEDVSISSAEAFRMSNPDTPFGNA
ncbi:MAG: hypothetical protein AB1442_06420 [Nitrospirota bacterium]